MWLYMKHMKHMLVLLVVYFGVAITVYIDTGLGHFGRCSYTSNFLLWFSCGFEPERSSVCRMCDLHYQYDQCSICFNCLTYQGVPSYKETCPTAVTATVKRQAGCLCSKDQHCQSSLCYGSIGAKKILGHGVCQYAARPLVKKCSEVQTCGACATSNYRSLTGTGACVW